MSQEQRRAVTCLGPRSYFVGGTPTYAVYLQGGGFSSEGGNAGFGGEFGAKKGASWARRQHFALTPGQRELGLAGGDRQEENGAVWRGCRLAVSGMRPSETE